MKKIFLLLTVFGILLFSGCTGPQGPPGIPGRDGYSAESEVFELQNVNFIFEDGGYSIYEPLTPNILDSDNILIYRMVDIVNPNTPIWQLIPRTLFMAPSVTLPQGGELDYDYDFSRVDFKIYAGGTYNLALTPEFIFNQTFRIVIIPGYFSNKKKSVDLNDYNAVIKAYGIDDTHVRILNSK